MNLPSQRERRRYVLARIIPEGFSPDPREVYGAIAEACTSLWGDVASAGISPSVMPLGGHVVVRCRRGTEEQLVAALATVTRIGDRRAALRPVTTGGTLHALRSRAPPLSPPLWEREVEVGGRIFLARARAGQKVDLIEKGIKSQELLFFTEEDGEVS